MQSVWNKIEKHWQLALAFFITYIVPILMLNEIVTFAKEVPAGIKITFMGSIAIGALFIIFYKKLKEQVIRMPKGVLRGILKIIYSIIFWAIIYGISWGLSYFAHLFGEYWIRVGVCFGVGHIFYMIDEVKKRPIKEQAN